MKTLTATLLVLLILTIQQIAEAAQSAQNADMPYQDNEFSCVSSADADRYVSDFKIDLASFGGNELCNANVDTKKLFNDLTIIEKGQFSNQGQNNLIRGFVDVNNYYGWMREQTRGVQRGNDIPYATAYNRGGYFTMQDGWAKLSTLGRVGTIVHEARHTQGYMHVGCNQGPYQGSSVSGCDTNYNYGGSHAIEMEYYARVSVQGLNFHPVYKKMARLMAIARSNIFFNTTPLKTREGIVALTADRKEAHLYDNGKWFVRETPLTNGRLKRTSFGAVLFDGLQALCIEMYQNSNVADAVIDTYSYFKLLLEGQNAVKEFEEFDSGIKRYVVQISNDNNLSAWDFPNGAWGKSQKIPFVVTRTSTAVAGNVKSGLFLINQAGQIYNYQPETQRLVGQAGAWDPQYKQVVAFNQQNLILKNDGKILAQKGSSIQPWSETNELYSDLVAVPLYDAFEVVKQ